MNKEKSKKHNKEVLEMNLRRKSGLSLVFGLSLIALLILGTSCSKNSMSVDKQNNLADIPVVESSTGPISLLRVDPEIQHSIENSKFMKTSGEVDSSLFYAEVFAEYDHDVKLEIKNGLNGDCKAEIKKENVPQDMNFVFVWAEGVAYDGALYSPDYSGEIAVTEPIKIELAFKNADWQGVHLDELGFYQLNESSNTWEKISCEIDDDKLKAELTRFGKFKLFQEINGDLTDFFMLQTDVFFTKKFIKRKGGGKLQVGSKKCGKSKIDFEKYDLPEDLEIEFKWAGDGSVSGLLSNMKFGPHGTYFSKPVKVELSYKMADLSGCDETKLVVYYYNEEEDIWEFIGGEVDIKKKKITVYLEHFSRYAVAYGR